MTNDDIDDVMGLVQSAWSRQNFTKEELELWRRTLRFFELDTASETIDYLVRHGQEWRPSVGEFSTAYRGRLRAIDAQTPPETPPEPDMPDAQRLVRARALKRVAKDHISFDEAMSLETTDA